METKVDAFPSLQTPPWHVTVLLGPARVILEVVNYESSGYIMDTRSEFNILLLDIGEFIVAMEFARTVFIAPDSAKLAK